VIPAELKFDADGLLPAVVQEAHTGELLMVAWMNREAVAATLATGRTHFWSRSRQALWRKGDTSGSAQHVRGVWVDCDADTLLVQVHQDGPACHTGQRSCFFRALQAEVDEPSPTMLARLEAVVAARKRGAPAGSYVGRLLAEGEPAICRKVGEEAVEVVTAALGGEGDRRVVEEVADLWFHTMLLLGQRGISLRDVLEELGRRHAPRGAAGPGP
jgi:phosphoribosyl-AMP cyclohydrolase / phosphoribosyl-ATP pyrophosphohydrolase